MNNNFSNLSFQILILLVLFVWMGFEAKGQNIVTVAGTGYSGYNGDGKIATVAELDGQTGAAIDEEGNLYISDFNNHRIRKVTTAGIITTIAGNGTPGFSGDGGPATAAKIFGPMGVAVDRNGNIYFADNYNQRIRKIDMSKGGTITTIAGTGTGGFAGNGGPSTLAKLQSPEGVAVDAGGVVYISDCDNNCIRKVTTDGIISGFAGNAMGNGTGLGNYSGDGKPALTAELNHPKGLAIDNKGNLYFADCFNHRIRKISTNGIISTVAGAGTAGFSGDSGNAVTAELNYPGDVTVDLAGNVFISDHANHRIRMVNKHGQITSVAGTGETGYNGDDKAATLATISNPSFVKIGDNGNLYIGDSDNARVRMVMLNTATSIASPAYPSKMLNKVPAHATSN